MATTQISVEPGSLRLPRRQRRFVAALAGLLLITTVVVASPVSVPVASAAGTISLLDKNVAPTTTLAAPAMPGATLTYSISYDCSGITVGDNCAGSIISDTLPTFIDIYGNTNQLEFVSASSLVPNDWVFQGLSGSVPNQQVTWSAAPAANCEPVSPPNNGLCAGDSGAVVLQLRVPYGVVPFTPTSQTVTNIASVSLAGQLDDQSTTATSYINALAAGSAISKNGPSTALLNAAGTDNLTYTVKICPQTNRPLWAAYTVTDTLPVGATPVQPLPFGGQYSAGTASTEDPPVPPATEPTLVPGTGGTIVWNIDEQNLPPRDAQGCLNIAFQVHFVNKFAPQGDLSNVVGATKTNSVSAVGIDDVNGQHPIGPATTTLTLNGPVTRFSPSKNTGGNYYVDNAAPDNVVTYTLGASNTSDAEATAFSTATLSDGAFPTGFALDQIDTGTWTGAVATVTASIETSPDGTTWTQVATAPNTTVTNGLAGVRYVRWVFTTVSPSTPAIGSGWSASGQHLIGTVSGQPTLTLTNCAALSAVQAGVQQSRGSACASVLLETPQPHPSISKSAPGTLEPGGTITYTLTAANNIDATSVLVDPQITDCVPDSAHLVVSNLRAGGVALPANGWTIETGPTPSSCTPTAPNAANSGTLIQLQYTGTLNPGESAPVVTYDVTADSFHFPTINDTPTLPGYYTNTANLTEADGSVFGHCVQAGCRAARTVLVPVTATLQSVKLVRGALDIDFNKAGTTTPGGQITWKVSVQNIGNVEVQNTQFVDIFPYIGDTGVRVTTKRGSEFAPFLTSPITAPVGWTAEYSTATNPCRPEVLGPNSSCTAPAWTTTPNLASLPSYKSIRLTYSGRIAIGASLEFEYDMVAPVFDPTYDTPNLTASPYDQLQSCTIPESSPAYPGGDPGNTTLVGSRTEVAAWVDNGAGGGIAGDGIQQAGEGGPTCPRASNSFAYGVSIPADQLNGVPDPGRLGAEPPKVDLHVAAVSPLNVIGNRVWEDSNNNGIQDLGEPGIAAVRVGLYQSNTLIDTTFTDANGNYLFENLLDGDYVLRFYMPDTRGYISPRDQTGFQPDQLATIDNTDNDSDIPRTPTGTDGIGNYYDTVAVTLGNDPGPQSESDPTWDAGIWIPRPSISLKKYVNGNDAQTAPGPNIPKGQSVTWTYNMTNNGNSYLKNISLTDLVTTSGQPNPVPVCDWANSSDALTPANVLSRGETVACTASGVAITGQYANTATVTGVPALDDGTTTITGKTGVPASVSATDPARYFGVEYDLALVKVADVATVVQGGTVQWTIRVVNQGNVASGAYTVTDTLPFGVAFGSATPSVTSSAGRTYHWTMPSLAAGATADIVITSTISDVRQRPFRNWAEISADSSGTYSTTDFDSTPNSNTGDDAGVGSGTGPDDQVIDNVSLASIPDTVPNDEDDNDYAEVVGSIRYDLALVKTVAPTPLIGADGLATWTITVKNQGDVDSRGYTVTDNVPGGLQVQSTTPSATSSAGRTLTWNMPNLAPGATATITIVTVVTAQSSKPWVNWAEISSDGSDYYTSVVGTVTDADSVPDAFLGDDPGAGSGTGPTNSVGTAEPNIDRTSVSDVNTDIASDEDDSDQAVLSSDISYDLALVKTVSAPTVAYDGTVTWTVTVRNQGNVASGGYSVTDTVPTGLTFTGATPASASHVGQVYLWIMPSLAPGATTTIVFTTTVNDLTKRPFRNWAEISSDSSVIYATSDVDSTPDANTGADTGGGTDLGSGPNDLVIDRTSAADVNTDIANDEDDNDFAQVDVPVTYDLALVKTASPITVAPDGDVTWTITVVNQGTVPAGVFTVRDVLPAGMTFQSSVPDPTSNPVPNVYVFTVPNLNPGASTTITIVSQVTDLMLRPFRNIAEISSDSASSYNVAGTTVTDVDSTPDSNPNNDGTYPAVGSAPGTGIDSVVIGDAGVRNGDPQDDADIADVNVDVVYDLALSKVVDATDLALNGPDTGTATFTITVANQGTVPSHGFTVTDWVPEGIEPVLPLSGSGVWNSSNRTITWSIGNMLPGTTATRSFLVTISDFTKLPYRNVAEITADSAGDYSTTTLTVTDADSTPDSDPANDGTYPPLLATPGTGIDNLAIGDAGNNGDPQDDADIADLTYSVVYDLALIKVNDGPAVVQFDDTIQFTITVQNQGNVQSHVFTVRDTLPTGLTVLDAGGGTVSGGTITWTINNLAPGASVTRTFTTTISDITSRPYRNVAEISTDSADDYDARGIDGLSLIDVEDLDSTPDTNTANDGTYPPLLDVPVPGTSSDNLLITEAGVENGDRPQDGGQDDADIADVGVDVRYDLALAKTVSSSTMAPDGSVTFTITVLNQGSVPSGDFIVTDTLPAGMQATAASNGGDRSAAGFVTWNLTGLNPGDVTSVTITAAIVDITMRPFKNIAEISADSADIYSTGTIIVTDADSTPDSDTTNDNSSSGTGPDGYGTYQNSTNDVTVAGGAEGADAGGQDDADVAFVDAPVLYDLALVKTGPNAIAGKNSATFTIQVLNQGNVDSGDYAVEDTIPAGLTATFASDGGTISVDGSHVTWNLTGLAAGATKTISVTVRITDFSQRPWVNIAEITSDGSSGYDSIGYELPSDGTVRDDDSTPDTNPSNDVVVDQTQLPVAQHNDPLIDEDDHDIAPIDANIEYDLALVKMVVANQSYKKGGNIAFHVLVMNQGNVDSGPVTVGDQLPPGLTFVSADNGGLAALNYVTWGIQNLTPGQIVTLTVVAMMADPTRASYINLAEIVADGSSQYDKYAGTVLIDDVHDEDSTPDSNLNNDAIVETDDVSIDQLPGDEDDHDRAALDMGKVADDNGQIPRAGSAVSDVLKVVAILLFAGVGLLVVSRRRRQYYLDLR